MKKAFEKSFEERMKEQNKTKQYGDILPKFDSLYKEIAPYALARDYFIEIVYRNNDMLKVGFLLNQLEQVYAKKGLYAFEEYKTKLMEDLEGIFKNYNKQVDKDVFKELITLYGTKAPKEFTPSTLQNVAYHDLADELYSRTALTSLKGIEELLKGSPEDVVTRMNNDYGYKLAKLLTDNFYTKIMPNYNRIQTEIDATQKRYMKAQLELFPEGRFFPDANSTLRVTYGEVKGYQPKDAVTYDYATHLDGVVEKYVPGDYEFDLPEKLLELYESKDYDEYANADGTMPVNFIGTNHTTGGNSGSPVLDAYGNLIGLNFDRVWEGTMSDIYYDPEICRNIMVDARYILFIIDKYANTPRLIDEIKIVYPKNNLK